MIVVGLQDEALETKSIVDLIAHDGAGAVVVFEGRTRAEPGLTKLTYEAFEERAAKQLDRFAADIAARDGIESVAAVHRTGDVAIGEPSVVVAVSATHRAEAFDGARDLIDRIKTEAAIWKKEVFETRENWVGLPQ